MSFDSELRELGEHLDHPRGHHLVSAMRADLDLAPVQATARRRRHPARWSVLVAAAVVIAAVLAVPATRTVVTDRIGSDATEAVRPAPSVHPDPTLTTGSSPPAISTLDLLAARAAVEIPIRVPDGIGGQPRITVDRRAPGGLVALEYPRFTVVEVAAPAGAAAGEVAGLGPASHVNPVAVRGQPGLWITGTHQEIAYLDRNGTLRRGPTRTTGHVLMWVEGGVTYRVEGFTAQSEATRVANALR